MRLYKYIQKDILQENLQYQDLVEYNTGSAGHPVYPSKKSIIRNYLDAMDFYTPTDTDYACRYRILTKIINKYYNYELFTDNYEYFGNRMLWRLNKIMPTYRAKFNSLLAQNGYEDIWDDGLLWEHREGTRDTKRPEKDTDNHPVNFDRTDLADTTTTVGYNSDYPQVIVGSSTDYNATGDKNTSSRTGNDTVTHAMQENVDYGEDITRKFSPEEIAKAKLLFAQLIFNIDEEIVNAVADLFVLVDYPFEDDFDVAIQMSILDDAKAYTNLKFDESKAYTDTQIGNLPKIIVFYNTSKPTLDDVNNYLSHEDLMLYSDGSKDFFLSDKTSYTMTFGCIVGTKRYSIYYTFATQTWSSVTITGLKDMYYLGSFEYGSPPPTLTVSELQSILDNNQYPYWKCEPSSNGAPIFLFVNNDTYNEKYIFQGWEIDGSIRRWFLSYRSGSYDSWSYDYTQYQTSSNLVTSWGNPTSDSKYPSEKLVKDSLDSLSNNIKLVQITYNSTPYTTIMEYVGYGQIPYFIRTVDGQPFVYIYQGNDTGDVAVFSCTFYNGIYYQQKIITVTYESLGADTWDEYSQDLQERLKSFGADQNLVTVNNMSLLTSDPSTYNNIDIHDLYRCTYGTTTYAEITQALADGKLPYCDYNGYRYIYNTLQNNIYYFRSAVSNTVLAYVQVANNDTWSNAQSSLQPARLVTSWQATPDDTHYPSEKLVKDSIDAIPKLFECTWGSTTYNEIYSAVDNNKLPIVFYNSILYVFQSRDANYCYFGSYTSAGGISFRIRCAKLNNTWSGNNATLQQKNLVTSWQATPDNTHYPSEKLVYDTIQGVLGSGVTSYLLDMSTYAYQSGRYTITGIDLTGATKVTLQCSALENPTNFNNVNAYIDTITATHFDIVSGNSISSNHLILTVYS